MAAENTVIFKSVAYSGGVILGGWGLVEIFLRVDPFYALFLRNLDGIGWLVMGAACALIAWQIAPGPLAPAGNPKLRQIVGVATAVLGLIVLALQFAAPGLTEVFALAALVFIGGALFATALACWVCPAVPLTRASSEEPARVWPHWLGIPVVVGMVVVAVMLLLLSTGRVRSLTEGDIAQEELRRGGLEFSMTSLQEALYLISPRSVELFRRANVDDGDIVEALGAPSDFTGEAPLITSILARIDGDDGTVCERDVLDHDVSANADTEADVREACARIDAFIRLFRVEPDPNPWRQLIEADAKDGTMCFTERPGVEEEANSKSGSDNENTSERSLCERLKDPIPLRDPDGAPPRPLLSYAFSGGHANVARCVLDLCDHPGSGIDVRPLSADPAVDAAFSPSQMHIRFALDPYLALEHGRSAPDSPWSPSEAENFEDFLQEVEVPRTDVRLGGPDPTPADESAEARSDLTGIHVGHADGRCRTRVLDLVQTAEDQLHDEKPVSSYTLGTAEEGAAPEGVLIEYGKEEPYLRFVHERRQEQGGERLTVLDLVRESGSNRGLKFLSGTDSSLLLWPDDRAKEELPVVDTVAPVVGNPVETEVARTLGWQAVDVRMPHTGRIVLTGRAESDLCLEVHHAQNPEAGIVTDAFVPHAQTFAVETDVLRAIDHRLRVTALRDDPDAPASNIRVAVRQTLFCTHEAPEDAGIEQVLKSDQSIGPYRVEEALGNRIFCPFRSEAFAQIALTAAAEADVEVRLVEQSARSRAQDRVSWIDSSGAGTAGAPARETVTALAVPKLDYVFQVRPYGDAELAAAPLEVSLVQGPAVTQDMIRAAVADSDPIDPESSVTLTPEAPPVAAARIAENGVYTVEAAGDTRSFHYDEAADSLLTETDGGGILPLDAGDVLVALATGPAGGRVTIDPMASRPIALGDTRRFEALESGAERIHVVQPEGNGPLEITLTPLEGQDLDLAVLTREGGELGSSEEAGAAVDSVTVEAREGTPLIVLVEALGTSAYSLRAADVRDIVDALPELAVGETLRHATLQAGERQRYRITADRVGMLTVTLSPNQGDLDLAVQSLSGDDLGTSENMETEPDAVTVSTVAGQILIVEVIAIETSGFSVGSEYP